MNPAPVKQERPAYGLGGFGRKSFGECGTLLQLLQCIRHIDPAALEFDRNRDEFPAALENEENEVASLSTAPMSLEGLVRIDDDALPGDVFEGHPASIPRAGLTTILGADVRADSVKDVVHSGMPPIEASASRFCNSAERL